MKTKESERAVGAKAGIVDVCIVAGEASGDVQGALLVSAWRERAAAAGGPTYRFFGAAGNALRAQGVEVVVDTASIAVMGFGEVLAHYGTLSREFRKLRDALHRRRPAIVVLVDYPGFNLAFAEEAHALGARVVYHIAPKAWAHGEGRAARLARYVDGVSCLLPFEEAWFGARGVNARFVGNPLADAIREFCEAHGAMARDARVVGLLPGSREIEIRRVLPPMVAALRALRARGGHGDVRGVIPVAPTLSKDLVRRVALEAWTSAGGTEAVFGEVVEIRDGGAYEVLSSCGYAWVCSGTATLEAALLGAPHAVVYKMSAATFQIAKRIVRLPWVSLVNLCAGKLVAPEFLQHLATPEALAAHAVRMLSDEGGIATGQAADFADLRARFPRDAAAHAATFFLSLLSTPRPRVRR